MVKAHEFALDLRTLHAEEVSDNPNVPVWLLCPFHSEDLPSFAVYPEHGYCYGCRKWEGYYAHIARVGDKPMGDAVSAKSTMTFRKSEVGWGVETEEQLGDLSLAYKKRLQLLDKYDFFLARGINMPTIEYCRLGHTGLAYTIPIFTLGTLKTIRFRRDDEYVTSGPKYYGIAGRNETYLYTPYSWLREGVVWCEGELDALLLTGLGYSAVTLTNGIGFVDKLERDDSFFEPILEVFRQEGVQEIRVLTDSDNASFTRGLKLSMYLNKHLDIPTRKYTFDAKDVTELYLSEDGEYKLRKLLWGLPLELGGSC